jgi:hypothetical protein
MSPWILVAAMCACGSRPAEPASPVPSPPAPEAPREEAAFAPDANVAAAVAAQAPEGDAEPAPENAMPAQEAIAPSTRELAGADTCVVEETLDVGSGGAKLRSLDIALGPRGGLVAWEGDTTHVTIAPIDRAGAATGPARTEEMPMGHRIDGVYPLGERFVLFTQSVCDDEPRKSRTYYCTFARGFGSDGAGLGPAKEMHDSWPESHVVQEVPMPDDLRLVWSDPGSGYRLFRYALDDRGAIARELVDETAEYEAVYQGYCSSDGQRVVALHNEEGQRYFRTKAPDDVAIVGLPPESVVLRCRIDGDEASMIFAPRVGWSGGRLRPRIARFGLDGKLRSRPRVIKRGEPPGAPFADVVRAKVERNPASGELTLTRTDMAGDAVGVPLVVSTAGTVIHSSSIGNREAVVWTGDRFLVAAAHEQDRAWKIAVHRVRCAR